MKYKPLITAAIVTIIIGSYCFFSDNEKCEKERKIFISKESSIKTAFCKNFNGKCYANYGFYARPALKRKQQLMIQIGICFLLKFKGVGFIKLLFFCYYVIFYNSIFDNYG